MEEDKVEQQKPQKSKSKAAPKWKRVSLAVCKWAGIPFLCLLGLSVGMVIGYVYIGKRPMDEVYQINTWRHIYDLVFSQTA